MSRKLAIFATHPIQYQVPIWRLLAANENLSVTVYYFSDQSVREYTDKGFGVNIKWDVPLLDGYHHIFLQKNADFSSSTPFKIHNPKKILIEGGFDTILLQGYMHKFERQLILTAKALKVKTLLRGDLTDETFKRGLLKTFIRSLYLKWFYHYIDSFCCVGIPAKQHLGKMGIAEKQMFISPYTVDTELFNNQKKISNKKERRSKLGIPDKASVLLFSGKLIPIKNPLLIIDALKLIPDTGNLHLIIVGDGELRKTLKEEARKVLGERLHMAGFVNQSKLGCYYSAADMLILPSEYETWGLVINEAMQFGLPVIVSDKVGCRHNLVLEDKTGFVFHANKPQSLAEKISNILNNPSKISQMGKNAAEHIKQYTTATAVQGILSAMQFKKTE